MNTTCKRWSRSGPETKVIAAKYCEVCWLLWDIIIMSCSLIVCSAKYTFYTNVTPNCDVLTQACQKREEVLIIFIKDTIYQTILAQCKHSL